MAKIVEELELGHSVKIREGRDGYEVTRVRGEGPIPRKAAVGLVATPFNVKDGTVTRAISDSEKRKSLNKRDR